MWHSMTVIAKAVSFGSTNVTYSWVDKLANEVNVVPKSN